MIPQFPIPTPQFYSLLVVEDNPADADLLRELLPVTGPVCFQVASVSRLSEALTRLERKGIDLVLLDLGLPDTQGLPTLDRLRALVPDVPVIVVTGTDDDEQGLAAVREGAQDYLVKGQISGPLLLRAACYAVERQKMTEALRQAKTIAVAALAQVKTLSGLLPICAGCKKIRDGQNYWHQVETYIAMHTDAQFTHGICPACAKKYFPELDKPLNS